MAMSPVLAFSPLQVISRRKEAKFKAPSIPILAACVDGAGRTRVQRPRGGKSRK